MIRLAFKSYIGENNGSVGWIEKKDLRKSKQT